MKRPEYVPVSSPKINREAKTWVITSCQADTNISVPFLKTLEYWAYKHQAQLVIKPYVYKNPTVRGEQDDPVWSAAIAPHILSENLTVSDNLVIAGGVHIQGATSNPLQAVGAISKGSVVIPHPVVGVKPIATPCNELPHYLISTGSVSFPNASATLAGARAEFHHTLGAIALKVLDNGQYLFRVLRWSEEYECIFDLNYFFTPDSWGFSIPLALVCGDLHYGQHDQVAFESTFGNARFDSMLDMLQPGQVILHDVLDWHSASHHPRPLRARVSGDSVSPLYEINSTSQWLKELCADNPHTAFNLVQSNHHEHFDKWLDRYRADSATADETQLFARTILAMSAYPSASPWEAYYRYHYGNSKNLQWLSNREGYYIAGIDVSQHGDRGINGARGSLTSYARARSKTVSGHTHEVAIVQGAMSVGCLCKLPESYSSGLSTHDHGNAIVYKDGSVSPLLIRNGQWC